MNKKHGLAIAGLIVIAIVAIGYWLRIAQPTIRPQPVVAAKTDVATIRRAEANTPAALQAGPNADVSTEIGDEAAIEEELDTEAEHQNYFLGRWCNNNLGKDSGEFFSLEFLVADDGETKAVFHNGGPFSENLNADLSEAGAELYFESVDGSMSLNEMAGNKDTAECMRKIASGKIIDKNNLEVESIHDVCGYMSAPANALILTRLNDGETCSPN